MSSVARAPSRPWQDLADLFRLDPGETQASATQRELHALHAAQRRAAQQLRAHLAFLAGLDCFAGWWLGAWLGCWVGGSVTVWVGRGV